VTARRTRVRFRWGLGIGLAVGYYFGARAGRSRYVQMEQWLQRTHVIDLTDAARGKAKAVVDLSVERARDLLPQGNPSDR
jgi:hypothetical protein